MPILDILSTFWSMSFGAQEVSPLPAFFIGIFGNIGLVLHATLFFLFYLFIVRAVLHLKRILNWRHHERQRLGLAFLFIFIFMWIAFQFSVAMRNLVLPLSLSNDQNTIIQIISGMPFFLGLLWFARMDLTIFLSRRGI